MNPDYFEALNRCIVESGIGEVEGDTPEEAQTQTEKALAMTQCLRGRGWDIPDPQPEPLGRYLQPPDLTVPDDPEAATAFLRDVSDCGELSGIPIEGEAP